MAFDNGRHLEVIGRLLELSSIQSVLLKEGRFEELFAMQDERERLFTALESIQLDGGAREALKPLKEALLESDRALSLSIEASMAEIRNKLLQLQDRSTAARAYGAR